MRTAGESATEIEARFVVNSAGLGAVDLLNRIEGYPPERIPTLHLARGNYFTVAARSPFHHLIYPVPHDAGLGIHATLDLGRRVRFGPDVEWIDRIDYSVNAGARAAVLRSHPPLLAETRRRRVDARLHRHPPQAARPGRTSSRLSASRPRRTTASPDW